MPKSLVDTNRLESLFIPLCKTHGVELVDVRHAIDSDGPVLRVLIELPEAEKRPPGVGITLEHCTQVSRAVSALLDADEELVPGAYRLEVSSPGVERPLVKPLDYERYAGREAQVSTKRPVDGRKKFSGILGGFKADQVLLRSAEGEELALPYEEIAKAHLIFRF
jgi:ribosome maturation factor RimP